MKICLICNIEKDESRFLMIRNKGIRLDVCLGCKQELAQNNKQLCSDCKIVKNIDEFEFRADTKKYRQECKGCIKIYNKTYRKQKTELECINCKSKENKFLQSKRYQKHYSICLICVKNLAVQNKRFCIDCNKIKNIESFVKNKNCCKLCHNNKEKTLSINKLSKQNSEIYKSRRKLHRQKNRNKIRAYAKKHYFNNKEIINENSRLFYQKNKKEINLKRGIKRKNDPIKYLHHTVSNIIRKVLKNKNNKSISEYLPYTIQELKDHLEKQFESWMSWSNRGSYIFKEWDDNDQSTWKWQIDHIIPQSELSYSSMEEENFKKCWSLDNLRPLSAKQNHLDGVNRSRHFKKVA